MANIEIWYDKPAEVDPVHSWAARCASLHGIPRLPLDHAPYPSVLALVEYARPDVVLTADGRPFLALELTQMNPSGHNLPQRFSCLVRAAELGVPAIFYYLEASRRSASDPNPRYVNIRTPLGQLRLSQLYSTPSLSVIWPTNPATKQAAKGFAAHAGLINFVDHAVSLAQRHRLLSNSDALVKQQFQLMENLIAKYHGPIYENNKSYNDVVAAGDCASDRLIGLRISPPGACQLVSTHDLLEANFKRLTGRAKIPRNKKTVQLLGKEFALIYTGTANKSKDGPEHPYPGYLTLIDVLYTRNEFGLVPRDRRFNLAFSLPIKLSVFKDKAFDRQTGLNILMEFSDLIILNDAVVVGGFLRNLSAGAVLI